MRKALIAGFFDFVEDAVRQDFGSSVDRGEIVVVGLGRVDPRRGMNLDLFKRALGQVLGGGCSDLLVVLGRSTDWLEESALAILVDYGDQCRIEFEARDDLRDAKPIIKRLTDFGLSEALGDAESVLLSEQLAGQRLFCVRAANQPTFERTLKRMGFKFDPEQFVEEAVPTSKNSNLVQSLTPKAEHFDWLLYAWAGLRTLPADVKRKFRCGALEADSPAKVVAMLKRTLLKKQGR